MTKSSYISRRQLLRTGVAAGAITTVGLPALAGCSNEGRGGAEGSQAENDAVKLPNHIPYQGVKPDLLGADGVSDAFLAYPADPVKATDGPPGDGQPVAALTMSGSPPPPAVGRNAFWQGLNERLGLPLSVQLVPRADFTDRFQTAVAGDQLPDLFSFTMDLPSLPAMLAKMAVDLTPLLSGDAVAKYPFLANVPTDSWRQTVYGGKIFGVPIPRGAALSSILYVRKDLLAARGLDAAPDSWESFHALCREATGGKVNTWALAAVPMAAIRQMFGIPNTWAEEGGRLTSAYEAERQQEALEAGRKLVADGLVHPDAFAVDQNQRKTWIANGTTLFVEDTFSAWHGFAQLAEPKRIEVTAYPPPLAEGGGAARIWLGSPSHNITAISIKSEARAEALLSVLNYLAAPFGTAEHRYKSFGEESVHHELQGTDPVLTEKGKIETPLSLGYLAEGPWPLYAPGKAEAVQLEYDVMKSMVPNGVRNPAHGLFSQTQSRKGAQLGGVLEDLESDILQGRKSVSEWAGAIATWKKNGGDTIRDELQQALGVRNGG